MSAPVRAAIVLGGVLLLALPGTAQRREIDVVRDLRRFYEATGGRNSATTPSKEWLESAEDLYGHDARLDAWLLAQSLEGER